MQAKSSIFTPHPHFALILAFTLLSLKPERKNEGEEEYLAISILHYWRLVIISKEQQINNANNAVKNIKSRLLQCD